MSNSIFISYAHGDRARAEQLIEGLRGAGYSVWWDHQIRIGKPFDQVIETAIGAAEVVIVLWSERSVASEWVRAEAAWALDDAKLLPVRIDNVRLPLRYTQIQTIDLSTWHGGNDGVGWATLLAELEERLGQGDLVSDSSGPAAYVEAPAKSHGSNSRRRIAFIVSCIVGLGVGAFDIVILRAPPEQIRSIADTSSTRETTGRPAAAAAAQPGAPPQHPVTETDASKTTRLPQAEMTSPKKDQDQKEHKQEEASFTPRADPPPAIVPSVTPTVVAPVTSSASAPQTLTPSVMAPTGASVVSSDIAAPVIAPRPSVAELIGEPIFFDKGKVGLSPAARLSIEQKITLLKENPGTVIMIEGYSFDDEGSRDAVQALAELRAMGVRRALVSGGIDEARFIIASRVNDAPTSSSQGRAQEPQVVLKKR